MYGRPLTREVVKDPYEASRGKCRSISYWWLWRISILRGVIDRLFKRVRKERRRGWKAGHLFRPKSGEDGDRVQSLRE
jgi:hypothetical protein